MGVAGDVVLVWLVVVGHNVMWHWCGLELIFFFFDCRLEMLRAVLLARVVVTFMRTATSAEESGSDWHQWRQKVLRLLRMQSIWRDARNSDVRTKQ